MKRSPRASHVSLRMNACGAPPRVCQAEISDRQLGAERSTRTLSGKDGEKCGFWKRSARFWGAEICPDCGAAWNMLLYDPWCECVFAKDALKRRTSLAYRLHIGILLASSIFFWGSLKRPTWALASAHRKAHAVSEKDEHRAAFKPSKDRRDGRMATTRQRDSSKLGQLGLLGHPRFIIRKLHKRCLGSILACFSSPIVGNWPMMSSTRKL